MKCYRITTTETVTREYIVGSSNKRECREKFKEDSADVEYLPSCDETTKVSISSVDEIDPDSDVVYKRAFSRIVSANENPPEPKKTRKRRKKPVDKRSIVDIIDENNTNKGKGNEQESGE